MNQLPSLWGTHREARFNAFLVRNTFITLVADAPAGWEPRLAALEFRRLQNGWARKGVLGQADYEYLSPDIQLIGFRTEQVEEMATVSPGYQTVPYDVQDSLLRLWQRADAPVSSLLSMEHGRTFSRAEAWSVMEAALEGAATPETETIYGLAQADLRKANATSPPADQFFSRIGLTAVAVSPRGESATDTPGPAPGARIRWTVGAEIREGRVASSAKTAAAGGMWVHSDTVNWVGGYPLSVPIWVPGSAVIHPGYDTQTPRTVEPEQVAVESGSRVAAPVVGGPTHFRLLEQLTLQSASKHLSFDHWNRGNNAIVERLRLDQAGEPLGDLVAWVNQLEDDLSTLSQKVYGPGPIGFGLIGRHVETADGALAIRYFVAPMIELKSVGMTAFSPDLAAPAEMDHSPAPGGQLGRALDIVGAADAAEALRAERQQAIESSARELARIAGKQGIMVPDRELTVDGDRFWAPFERATGGQLTREAMLQALSIKLRGTPDLTAQLSVRGMRSDFFQSVQVQAAGLIHNVDVAIHALKVQLIDLDEVVAHSAAGRSLQGEDARAISRTAASRHEVQVVCPATLHPGAMPALAGVSLRFEDRTYNQLQTRALLDSEGEAQIAYVKALEGLRPLATPAAQNVIKSAVQAVSGRDLYDEAAKSPEILRAIPRMELEERVAAELSRQGPRFSKFSIAFQGRIAAAIAKEITVDGVQGAVILMTTNRYYMRPVRIDPSIASSSRLAVMGSALATFKSGQRKRGTYCFIDGIAIAQPQLVARLDADPITFKSPEGPGPGRTGDYQDTGDVAGLAAKDIRGFKRHELLDKASAMNDQQRLKYVSKDLIWPRKAMAELRENGVEIGVAYLYDLVWKALPKAPKSVSWLHVEAFVHLVTTFREELTASLDLPLGIHTGSGTFLHVIKKAGELAFNQGSSVGQAYSVRDVRVGRYGLWLSNFVPEMDSRLFRDLKKLDWADLIKTPARVASRTPASRVQKDEVVRVGPDYRAGKSVTGEDFIRTFGFSGVEYGNWTTQKERERHLNLAYDSMMDFARVMDWDPLALSLGGRLGLCIGSRGKGGANPANAHFDAVNQAINLTRMRGDGCLVHEYIHAVANHFGRLATGSPQDIMDTFGYSLRKEGAVPKVPTTLALREPVLKAFHQLLVAIMRSPAPGADATSIGSFTEQSALLSASKEVDGPGKDYWAQPAELFARTMETWFKETVANKSERNDYLVSASKSPGGVYPSREHLEALEPYIQSWVAAIQTEHRLIQHPFLGELSMPILNSEWQSRTPMAPADLRDFAAVELERLFGERAPDFRVTASGTAGAYHLGRHLIELNSAFADRDTFYHEAWHAAHDVLLTSSEQQLLAKLFAPSGKLASRVASLMVEHGQSQALAGLEDTRDVQAYAFQLWKAGHFHFDRAKQGQSFEKVDAFIAGCADVVDLLGGEQAAEELFKRFAEGELKARDGAAVAYAPAMAPLVDMEWDAADVLVWDLPTSTRHEGPGLR